MRAMRNEKGVALIFALLLSLAIMAMVTGMLYFVDRSTAMSGAGKRYATAAEAADGAINVVKDTINLVIWGETTSGLLTSGGGCLTTAILNEGSSCSDIVVTLPSDFTGVFTATVTVERLYSVTLPGSRLEFSRAAGGVAGEAIYFRITSKVKDDATNTTAENSALYRFAG